ncbi:septum formation family protein [Mycobacterium sp. MMS18-G62]
MVDCAKPHLAEVYAVLPLPDGNFPEGVDANTSKQKCGAVARTFVTPEEGLDPSMRTLVKFPDQASWGMGDRSITCFLAFNTARTGAFGAGRWTK